MFFCCMEFFLERLLFVLRRPAPSEEHVEFFFHTQKTEMSQAAGGTARTTTMRRWADVDHDHRPDHYPVFSADSPPRRNHSPDEADFGVYVPEPRSYRLDRSPPIQEELGGRYKSHSSSSGPVGSRPEGNNSRGNGAGRIGGGAPGGAGKNIRGTTGRDQRKNFYGIYPRIYSVDPPPSSDRTSNNIDAQGGGGSSSSTTSYSPYEPGGGSSSRAGAAYEEFSVDRQKESVLSGASSGALPARLFCQDAISSSPDSGVPPRTKHHQLGPPPRRQPSPASSSPMENLFVPPVISPTVDGDVVRVGRVAMSSPPPARKVTPAREKVRAAAAAAACSSPSEEPPPPPGRQQMNPFLPGNGVLEGPPPAGVLDPPPEKRGGVASSQGEGSAPDEQPVGVSSGSSTSAKVPASSGSTNSRSRKSSGDAKPASKERKKRAESGDGEGTKRKTSKDKERKKSDKDRERKKSKESTSTEQSAGVEKTPNEEKAPGENDVAAQLKELVAKNKELKDKNKSNERIKKEWISSKTALRLAESELKRLKESLEQGSGGVGSGGAGREPQPLSFVNKDTLDQQGSGSAATSTSSSAQQEEPDKKNLGRGDKEEFLAAEVERFRKLVLAAEAVAEEERRKAETERLRAEEERQCAELERQNAERLKILVADAEKRHAVGGGHHVAVDASSSGTLSAADTTAASGVNVVLEPGNSVAEPIAVSPGEMRSDLIRQSLEEQQIGSSPPPPASKGPPLPKGAKGGKGKGQQTVPAVPGKGGKGGGPPVTVVPSPKPMAGKSKGKGKGGSLKTNGR